MVGSGLHQFITKMPMKQIFDNSLIISLREENKMTERFEIDIRTLDKNKRLYSIDSDIYLEFEKEVFSFGKILSQYSHPWVGTYFVDLRNEKVFKAITTYQEIQGE
jgi:hypothetical protein